MNIYIWLALLACFNNEAYSAASYLHIISLSLFMSKIHVTEISLRIWRLLAEREKKTQIIQHASVRAQTNSTSATNSSRQEIRRGERREERGESPKSWRTTTHSCNIMTGIYYSLSRQYMMHLAGDIYDGGRAPRYRLKHVFSPPFKMIMR